MDNINELKPQPKYWMSLDQWTQDPEFLKLAENEFLSSPMSTEGGQEDRQDSWARREFLKLMGASLALTTFGCVRRPAQKIIPYAKKPEEVIHGIANHYASSFSDGAEVLGILVTTRDGRPIKIEGNPKYPTSMGGMSAKAHAHILKLYDPDRLNGPRKNLQNEARTNKETVGLAWDKLDEEVVETLKKGKVAILSSTISSPSTRDLISNFSSAVGAKTYTFDEINYDAIAEGQKLSYGQALIPNYQIDKAKYILAVNNDFLGTWLTPVVFQAQFAKGRKNAKEMSKLVVVESLLSMTGTNADERFKIRPSQTLAFLMALAYELNVKMQAGGTTSNSQINAELKKYSGAEAELGLKAGTISKIAKEIAKFKGESLVLAGGMSANSEDAVAIQVAANLINSVLGNEGATVNSSSALKTAQGSYADIQKLMTSIHKGEVNTLIIHGVNPSYVLPQSSQFQDTLRKVPNVIYTGDRNDETGIQADYIAADHNPLENWGDMESIAGLYSIQQPTIEPLYNTRAFQDSLLVWAKGLGKTSGRLGAESWYDYVRGFWKSEIYPKAKGGLDFEKFWVHALQAGVVEAGSGGSARRSFSAGSFSAIEKVKPAVKSAFELSLFPTIGLGSGDMANVSWLQEFPDPVTKICWDNYLTVSIEDAQELKLSEGQMVNVSVSGKKLDLPVHVQPGQAKGALGLAVGYGRKGAGKIAQGVGANAFELSVSGQNAWITAGLPTEVKVLKTKYDLACTQGHHSMEGRQIVVEETLAQFIKKPGGQVHRHKMWSMWESHKYTGNKWGMVIDLNSCTGCGSCVIACQSENNIPTVGKKYVLLGREMHWIRIDRYYVGDPTEPNTVHQPIVCMHCDNAPCESVCPVAATVHSDEGTNDMIYNRCVGTRYCSNNCPYKVRRFNWFSYRNVEAPKHLAMNPEVTVRHRGVMEKCTFCLHRIRSVKSDAKVHDRTLKDGDVMTACQQSCPAKAIVFGDLNDPNSKVAKMFQAEQAYDLLEEQNTKPAVRYFTKVRNTDVLKGPQTSHEGGHEDKHEEAQGEKEQHS